MTSFKKPLTAALLCVGIAASAPAFAQDTGIGAPKAAAQMAPREHRGHVEGRIAFLKAELKITPEQQVQWEKVAAAMRDNARDMTQVKQQRRADRDTTKTAIDSIAARDAFAQLRLRNDERFLAAFKPLYDAFSPAQKQAADALFAGHHRHHHHRA